MGHFSEHGGMELPWTENEVKTAKERATAILRDAKGNGGRLSEFQKSSLNELCNGRGITYSVVEEMARGMRVTDSEGRPLYERFA